MSHVTFYRKYRSKVFSEIVGQDHIIGTLENAIKFDRLAHAYIFSGPRGTGKTSTARILAKALNCRKGKSVQPCLECDLCKRISLGQSVDVIELDAASNTGVDNVRVLNEQVTFSTVECLYRIFIIDEAHMLSTGAFNALLKTLEEPPGNTIFILATTEPQKIPATIHSRCQHLHFRKLRNSELIAQLKLIAEAEKLSIADKSLQTIARNAAGCMRDAISLLDQIYSFKGKDISQEDVLLILGAANYDRLYTLISHFLKNDTKETIAELNKLYDEGINVIQLLSNISLVFHQMLFVKMNLGECLDLDEARIKQVKELVNQTSFEEIVFLFESFSKTEMDLRWFPNPELFLQVRFLLYMNALKTKDFNVNKADKVQLEKQPKENVDSNSIQEITMQSGGSIEIAKEEKPGFTAAKQEEEEKSEAVEPEKDSLSVGVETENDMQSFSANWYQFLDVLGKKAGAVFAVIFKDAKVINITDSVIYIKLKQDCKFYKDKLNEEKYKLLIQDLLKEIFKKPVNLDFSGKFEETEQDLLEGNAKATLKQDFKIMQANSESMKINKVVELFEGKVIQ